MAHSEHFATPWYRALLAHVGADLPTLVLLTLVVFFLHQKHVFDWSEGLFRRQVIGISTSWELSQGLKRTPPQDAVSVLMVSPYMRITELEKAVASSEKLQASDRRMIDRVGGVRPIDRCEFAGLLELLAVQIAEPRNSNYLKVIGLDVDIAPLEDDDLSSVCAPRMIMALTALRKKVTVVAIVMARATADAREKRNRFYTEDAQCTRYEDKHTSDGLLPLYLASPRVVHRIDSYPIDFPFEKKKNIYKVSGQRMNDELVLFPSLSNMLLASAFRSGTHHLASLTMLCEQSRQHLDSSHQQEQLLLEDWIENYHPGSCNSSGAQGRCKEFSWDDYGERPINWRWLETDAVLNFVLNSRNQIAEGKGAAGELMDLFSAAALIVGVDGGNGFDKYRVASAEPISGAMLHALQTASVLDENRVLHVDSVWSILADFAMGLAFLFFWKAVVLLSERTTWLARTQQTLKVAVPLVLALCLAHLGMEYVAPWLVIRNIWANPAYLMVGLALHAYLEGWHSTAGAHSHMAAGFPDFTFGVIPKNAEGKKIDSDWIQSRLIGLFKLAVVLIATAVLLWPIDYGIDPLREGARSYPPRPLVHWGGWAGLVVLILIAISAYMNRRQQESK